MLSAVAHDQTPQRDYDMERHKSNGEQKVNIWYETHYLYIADLKFGKYAPMVYGPDSPLTLV